MNKQDFITKKPTLKEDTIDRLRYIVDNNDARRVQFDNGESMTVDMFTASAIVNLHNAVNDQNKAKIEDTIGKSKEMFYKIADFAFSNLKENAQSGRGDVLINDDTETVKMTESAYGAKPKSSRITIKDQPYILINKPGIGETAYSVKFTKNNPILEQKEFEAGTRVHAGVGKKGGAGISGVVMKEENGYVFFKSDEGKNYKAPKAKVMPVSDIKFNEGKDVPSKHQEKIAKDTVKNPDKALLGGPSEEEAEKMLKNKFGYTDAQITKLKKTANEGKHSKSQAQQAAIAISKKEKKESINEKSVSKDQQQAAGAALAAKRGETPVSELQGASKEMYDSMTKKELEDFAGTKHAGLPEKVDEAKDYKAEKNSEGRYTIWTVGETGSRQDMVKDGLTKAQAKKMIDKLYSKDLGLIDEDSLDENAFNQAAAEAAKAGKKEFEFDGKTYPVKMDKSTAEKLDDDLDPVDAKQARMPFKRRKDKDINNDGEVDSTDEYLHARRNAIQTDIASPLDEQDMDMDMMNQPPMMDKAMQDPDDYGPQAGSEMAETQIHYLVYAISEIKEAMRAGYHMPDWLQNKISSAHQDMQGIHSYMEGSRLKRQMCGPISEGYVGSDYGPEAASGMARTQLSFMKYAAEDVLKCISAGTPIPEWYQNKIAKVHRAIETIYAYIEGTRRAEEDDVPDMTTNTEMSTPASQPPMSTGTMFAGGEEDYMAENRKKSKKYPPKLNENKKSDWDVDKQVKRTQASPLFKATEGDKDPEEIKQDLLQDREKFEKKLSDAIFLPVNDSVVALQDLFRDSSGTIAAYLSDNEKKFLKEFHRELKKLHDKFEESSIISSDYL